MRKSPKFVLAAVLVAVMVIGCTAGVALARDEDEAGQGSGDALMTRVAEILDVDQQQLEDAFRQAKSEFREEALDSRLQRLIDEGTLTQEQAEEFKAWIEARPDVPRFGPKGFHKLADEGVLTQEQLDQLEALKAEMRERMRDILGGDDGIPQTQ